MNRIKNIFPTIVRFFSLMVGLIVVLGVIKLGVLDGWGPASIKRDIRNGDLTAVVQKLSNKKHVDFTNIPMRTLLHDAAASGNVRIAQYVLLKTGNVDAKGGKQNSTPLIIASRRGYYEIVKLLLDNGANINLKNDLGVTALMSAARGDNVETIKLLLSHGAKVNDKSYQKKRTALEYAVKRGNYKSVELLLAKGADTARLKQNIEMTISHLKGIPDAPEYIKNRYRKVISCLQSKAGQAPPN